MLLAWRALRRDRTARLFTLTRHAGPTVQNKIPLQHRPRTAVSVSPSLPRANPSRVFVVAALTLQVRVGPPPLPFALGPNHAVTVRRRQRVTASAPHRKVQQLLARRIVATLTHHAPPRESRRTR